MKKDITLPEVKEVFIAAVQNYNKEFQTHDWNAYLINNNSFPIEMVLVVTKGYTETKKTSTMRHNLKVLPAKSFAKIELLQPEILSLNNEFSVSYFAESTMFHKKFTFKKNSIAQENISEIPLMPEQGVLAV